MLDIKNDEHKTVEDLSGGPVASFAFVLKMPIVRMPEVFHKIEEVPGARIVYMKTSAGRLTISEER